MMGTCGIEYGVASFKGVEFEIQPSSISGGRRVSTALYPYLDMHYNEDLGDKPLQFSVAGLWSGDDYRDKYTAAMQLWRAGGDGLYFDPTLNQSFACTLTEFTVDLNSALLNTLAFTLTLIESAADPFPRRAVQDTLADVPTRIAALLAKIRKIKRIIDVNANEAYRIVLMVNSFITNASSMFSVPASLVRVYGALGDLFDSDERTGAANDVLAAQESVFEAAIESGAPLEFFKRASEINETSGALDGTASTALAYYFEKLTLSGAVSFTQLADFRTRALAVKLRVPELANEIDGFLLSLGKLSVADAVATRDAGLPVLVLSYRACGNISRANDIIVASGGVSGAKLVQAVLPCQN